MCPRSSIRPDYSRAERLSDAVVHVLGLAVVLTAVPVLITRAAEWRGDVTAIVATAIYGGTFLAMILFSALYHMVPLERWKGVLKRLDHSAIYFKIAGTYTPFTLLSGGHGTALLTGLWGAAVAGSGLKILAPNRFRWLGLVLYLGMGWVGVVAGWAVFAELSGPVLWLVVAGGALYSIGVVFFLWEVLPFHNTIWHVFVLAASILFYAAVLMHLADTAVLFAGSGAD